MKLPKKKIPRQKTQAINLIYRRLIGLLRHQFTLQEKFENWPLKFKRQLRQGGGGYRLAHRMPITRGAACSKISVP